MMRIGPINLRDPRLCRQAWRLQQDAYEIEAKLIGSRGMQALNETVADLASNTSEAFEGCFVTDRGASVLAGLIATEQAEVIEPARSGADTRAARWITRLAVAPAFARRGIGRTLVRHVVEQPIGGDRWLVSTGAANHPAVRLYQSVGFAIVESATAPDGTPLVRLALRRNS